MVLNGAVIVYALLVTAADGVERRLVSGRPKLPWWIVGLSAFATAIDSSDIVADAGGVYSLGIALLRDQLGRHRRGWVLLAHFIALPMYRAGMYTNSEYLEAQFRADGARAQQPGAGAVSHDGDGQHLDDAVPDVCRRRRLGRRSLVGRWALVVLASTSVHDLGRLAERGAGRRRAVAR